jgi:hypothetical protein
MLEQEAAAERGKIKFGRRQNSVRSAIAACERAVDELDGIDTNKLDSTAKQLFNKAFQGINTAINALKAI